VFFDFQVADIARVRIFAAGGAKRIQPIIRDNLLLCKRIRFTTAILNVPGKYRHFKELLPRSARRPQRINWIQKYLHALRGEYLSTLRIAGFEIKKRGI
jgi:hypothetical protein